MGHFLTENIDLALSKRTTASDLYQTTRWFSEALIRLRPEFNQDLDQLVMFTVFLLGPLNQEARGRETHGPEARGQEVRQGMNALSVSEITGIARETTRRKLRELAKTGFVRQDPDGLWRLGAGHGSEPSRDLQPILETFGRSPFP